MCRHRLLALLLVILPSLALASPARADFAAGAEAYDGGDYQRALDEWRPLAEAGDPRAQIALASMYQFGEGVPEDEIKAAKWYWRAAEQGEPVAQINLAKLYATGRGLARDYVRAYMWFDIAALRGRGDARKARDDLAAEMAPWQIELAESLAEAWQPKADPRIEPEASCECALRHAGQLRQAE